MAVKTSTESPAGADDDGSPWRSADFRSLFAAAAISRLGTQIGHVAVPLVAVSALDAGPGQVGALAALSTVAFLLIGLPAGVWVDRLRRRRLMIGADLLRFALLASVPVTWALDGLTLYQLYAVVLLNGCATVFFEVAVQSHLPGIVSREALIGANAGLVGLNAVSNIAGRGLGGFLVQLTSAPVALAADAFGYLWSAACLSRMRRDEPVADGGTAGRARLLPGIREGLRHVFGSRELRPIAIAGAVTNLGAQIINTMLPVLFVRDLGLSATALGLFWAVGGAGVLLGARLARPLARRLGLGRTLGLAGLAVAPAGLLLPMLERGPWLWAAGAGWLLATAKMGVDNVLAVSLRQRLTPDGLLGRMNATFRCLLTGALAVGAAVAGLVGEYASVRAALWVGGCCLALVWLPVLLSPVRALHVLPPGPVPEGPPRGAGGLRA